MLNDRKDKYEGNQPEEEGEYHFSEEDVSYEVEPESPKTPPEKGGKGNLLNRLSGYKRIIISVVVFVILIFIVYKVLTPATTTSSINISQIPSTQPPPVSAAPPTSPAAPISAAPPTAPSVPQQAQAVPQAQPPAPMQPTAPSPAPQAQPAAPVQTTVTQTTTTQNPAPQATLPSVIPVPTPQAAYPTKEIVSETASGPELRMATMAANNEKLITQFQAEYNQKITEFTTQTKVLQDQMQALTTRVTAMENQLNQLVQTLTRQSSAALNPPANVQSQVQSGPEIKIPFSVQAIIPGRAWLRADNGETITVAEGDVVKALGRVTKIDPYDGVVEINTGTKTISLSYGMGG